LCDLWRGECHQPQVAGSFRLDILDPDTIAADEPLIGGHLGLDSLDAVELGIRIEEEFGIAICGSAGLPGAFASIASLADFIRPPPAPKAAEVGVAPQQRP
jgi:acyl carrier protein